MNQHGKRPPRNNTGPAGGKGAAPRKAVDKATDARNRVKEQILEQLRSHERGYKTRSLFSLLGRPLNYGEFIALLEELAGRGEIRKGEQRHWITGGPVKTVNGLLLRAPSGHGFLQPDDGSEKIFIHRNQLDRFLQEDVVSAKILPQSNGPTREGRILALIARNLERLVGRTARYGAEWVLLPESVRYGGMVRFRGPLPQDLAVGERVSARLLPDPDEAPLPAALWVQLDERLSGESDAAWLQERVKAEFNLPGPFPEAAEEEAGRFHEDSLVLEPGRLDLRDECIFTIDPADAKDFDDAVSLQLLENGDQILGVHIADVSRFVAPGGALDREALRRGQSVYLPGEVIPMLPHALSSGLCSLQEGRDRCCYSALMTLSPKGVLKDLQLSTSLIRSRRRFSYDEVQAILASFADGKGAGGDSLDPQVEWPNDEIKQSLYHMDTLWRLLKQTRLQHGGLDFALPEATFVLDEAGNPLEVHPRLSREANFLIEEFMLMANRCVAQALSKARRQCLYRVHAAPSGDKLERFQKALEHLGFRPAPTLETVRDWQRLLKETEQRPEAPFLHQLTLRTMMKAQYTPENIGHFGLGFGHYAHFTSPIRRYPDLVVHRLLKLMEKGFEGPPALDLELPGRHCNQRELLAMEAERTAVKLKQILFLGKHLGDEFWGRARGVERFGVFVELEDSLAEGLIPMAELPEDYWDYNEAAWELRARRTGQCIRIGDRVKVKVIRTDPDAREVDFKLIEVESLTPTAPGKVIPRQAVNPRERSKARRGPKSR